MDYAKTVSQLYELVGTEKNIKTVTHCMTRMRFVLLDESIVNDEKVKAVPGVLGVARQGGQYQVIIGNDVTICYDEFLKLGNFSAGSDSGEKTEAKDKITPLSVLNGIIDAISGSIAPILPVIIGCGMLRLLETILGLVGVSESLPTYQIISIIGDAGFYFLPIILAASAAKKFGCTPYLAMAMTAVLIHPDLIALLAEGNSSFLTLPVTSATYSSTVIPAILVAWLLSKVEPIIDRHMKGWVKTIFKLTLILLIGVPIMLIIVAPLGAFAGDGLNFVIEWLQVRYGWITYLLLAAFCPLIVMTGMHYALIPTTLMALGTVGYDTILGPMMLASNLAQAAASGVVAIRSKNSDLKALAATSSISAAVAGITEPALYGVTMRLKKPLIASMIGSAAGGLFAGIVGLRNYALVTPALISIVQFISPDVPNNFIYACITAAISVGVTIVLALILGWDDPVDENTQDIEEMTDMEDISEDVLTSPLEGTLMPLSEVKDETFASGMLGDGVAVLPSTGKVYAPCAGTVSMVFDTGHAIGLSLDNGMELLIHVGINTVELNGKGFAPAVKAGDKMRRGQLLMNFDREMLLKEGYDITTAVIVTDGQDKELQILADSGEAERKTEILRGV